MSFKPLFAGTMAAHSKIRIYGVSASEGHKLVSVTRPPNAIRHRGGSSPQPKTTTHSALQIITFVELENTTDAQAAYTILSIPKRVVDAGIPLGALDFLAGAARADISILEDV